MKTLTHWKDFFIFLRSPDDRDAHLSTKDKIWLFINLFILQFLLIIPEGVLLTQTHLMPSHTLAKDNKSFFKDLGLSVFAGVFEEVVYRLNLIKFKVIYLVISLTGLIFTLIKKISFHNMLLDPKGLLLSALIAFACFPILYFVVRKFEKILSDIWEKHFGYVFYVSSFLFALSHFFNSPTLELSYLPSTITQLTTALILGFIRIRSGLLAAIILHIAWDIAV